MNPVLNEAHGTMHPILRIHEVERFRGLSRTTHYQQIADGLFPPPVRIGARAVGWPANEVEAINAARIAGRSESDIRELVKRLLRERVSQRVAA